MALCAPRNRSRTFVLGPKVSFASSPPIRLVIAAAVFGLVAFLRPAFHNTLEEAIVSKKATV